MSDSKFSTFKGVVYDPCHRVIAFHTTTYVNDVKLSDILRKLLADAEDAENMPMPVPVVEDVNSPVASSLGTCATHHSVSFAGPHRVQPNCKNWKPIPSTGCCNSCGKIFTKNS